MSDDTPPSIDMPIMFQLVRNNDALRAENGRLREALTMISTAAREDTSFAQPDPLLAFIVRVVDAALVRTD